MTSEVLLELFWTMMPMLVGFGVLMVLLEILKIKIDKKIKQKRGETTDERISRLSKALKESVAMASEIEAEVRKRHELVEKLQADVDRYDELAKLKGSEVEAIAQTLRGELESEGKRSFLKSFLVSLFFFVAGIVATLLTAI